jgi:phosphoenolpyruvate synthase/pyruvate phosphate dikinase
MNAVQIVLFLLFLGLAAGLFSLLFTYLKPHCAPFLANNYEHFADAAAQGQGDPVTNMIRTMDFLKKQLEIIINNVGDMKAQTCSIYDVLHRKFIQTKGVEAPDNSEYSLPREEQAQLQTNRMKYAEQQWMAKLQFFKVFYRMSMLDCVYLPISPKQTKPKPKPKPEPVPENVEGFSGELAEKVAEWRSILIDNGDWIQDCDGITGVATFVTNEMASIIKKIDKPDISTTTSETGQVSATKRMDEGFEDSPPKTDPMVDAQELIDKFKISVVKYVTAQDVYSKMNQMYKNYLAYMEQLEQMNNASADMPTMGNA